MTTKSACDWQVEYGAGRGILECGKATDNASGWCDDHEAYALENWPQFPLPVKEVDRTKRFGDRR